MTELTIGTVTPQEVTLAIYRGDTLDTYVRLYSYADDDPQHLTKVYLDLTGCTVVAQVRTGIDGNVLCELDLDIVLPQTGADKGRINIGLDETVTADLPITAAARWDLQVTDTGLAVRTRARGPAVITGDVSIEAGS